MINSHPFLERSLGLKRCYGQQTLPKSNCLLNQSWIQCENYCRILILRTCPLFLWKCMCRWPMGVALGCCWRDMPGKHHQVTVSLLQSILNSTYYLQRYTTCFLCLFVECKLASSSDISKQPKTVTGSTCPGPAYWMQRKMRQQNLCHSFQQWLWHQSVHGTWCVMNKSYAQKWGDSGRGDKVW